MNAKVNNLIQSIPEAFNELVSVKTVSTAIAVILILVVGLGIVRLLFNAIRRFSRKGLPRRSAMILENLVKYGGYAIVLLTASKRAGLDISALLGAAGIAGIALGFAAQTSVANVISGLFLFSEHAFKIGDVLQIDTVAGISVAHPARRMRFCRRLNGGTKSHRARTAGAQRSRLIPAIIESLAKNGIPLQSRKIEVSSINPIPGTSRSG
ncbi:MAG: mechanosensitive ion channel domain-containing protein [Spirochaetales bacterium]|jgi:small-conductance mechanosensitive channel